MIDNGKVFKYLTQNILMRVRKITEVLGLRVYTDSGEYFGEVEEANLFENRVDGWRIRVGGGVASLIGGARGVIIPHQFVKSIGDVLIISSSALPSMPDSVSETEDAA
ncbi:MAG: PRC-barrel domain-containing protein [Candidatus Nanoarchaeia archaeon]|nr:PRC-barrel domain-containing protein [Candidatus Nanoarchaeia archaeon]